MGRRKKIAVHPSIKDRLGYDRDMPDEEFFADWKERSTHVCKPCWELKYCPYGPLIEQAPLLPPLRAQSVSHNEYLKNCVETGMMGSHGSLPESTREVFENLVELYEEDFDSFAAYVADGLRRKEFASQFSEPEELIDALAGPLPPMHQYRAPFPFGEEELREVPDISYELQEVIDSKIDMLRKALESGEYDGRVPLDQARRKMFEAEIEKFEPDALPEAIPDVVSDMSCNIFGHICPIVFVGENISETSEERRRGRYIPFSVKMRVVRRDNHTCQECGAHLRDDEVEFDHIIPVAKGGSSEEHNIRLTCFGCNRSKSDSVSV